MCSQVISPFYFSCFSCVISYCRWYNYPLPSYRVHTADTLRDLVILTFELLTLVSGHGWRVIWSIRPPCLKILRRFFSWVTSSDASHRMPLTMRLQPSHVLRMRRIMWPMRRGKFLPYIWNPWPQFAYSLHNMALRLKQIELSAKILYGSVLKTTLLSAHARNHVRLEEYGKYLTVIVLGDHDFLTSASNFGNLAAFMAMTYFCFRSSWSTDLERVSRVSSLTSKNFRPSLKLLRPSGRLVIAFLLVIRYIWPCDLDLEL